MDVLRPGKRPVLSVPRCIALSGAIFAPSKGLKRGSVDATEPPILRKLGLSERQWHQQMLGTETNYWRAIGSAQALIEKAASMRRGWLKGIGNARRLLRPQAA